jgi:hypothetical protein
MANITINPVQTTNAAGSFYASSTGYVQGVLLDDPVTRFKLNQGIVGLAVTTPMWGGEGITESLWTPGATGESDAIGSVLTLATAQANLTGFTVFNQATAMVQSPQSPAPLAAAGMGVDFVRFGSGARIAVAISNANALALEGGAINVALYWDYTNQVLLTSPGGTAIAAKLVDVNVGNSQIVSYNSGTGFATWNRTGSTAVIEI